MRFNLSIFPLLILLLGTVGVAATQFSDVSIKNTLAVGTNKLVVSGGNVGVNKSNPATALDINGTATATAFVGPLTGAASSNVLKSGDTMTGALTVDNTGAPTSNASVSTSAIGTTNDPGAVFLSKRARASTSATASGDTIGQFIFQAHDGTSYRNAGSILSTVDGTVSTGIVPGRMAFFTQNTSGTNTERMRIDSAGNVGIATTSPSAKLHVNGTLKIGAYTLPSTDGTAGQIPSTNGSGTVSWITKGTVSPVIQTLTTGTNFNKPYAFFITSGSATAGATFTHNSVTYTVVQTISSETTLIASGSAAPLTSGTLTKASGTGDSTITFSSFTAPSALHIRMVGGGGGGAGSAPVSCGPNQGGNNGGATTFGPTGNTGLLTANGGSGGVSGGGNTAAGGAGGTATIGSASGVSGVGHTGAQGGGSSQGGTGDFLAGGGGGSSCFGGAGMGGPGNIAGGTAAANSGSGGGGGGSAGTSGGSSSGAGGGAAGCLDAVISGTTLASNATFTYAIGASGSNGGGGCSTGLNGGPGADGKIIVRADYP